MLFFAFQSTYLLSSDSRHLVYCNSHERSAGVPPVDFPLESRLPDRYVTLLMSGEQCSGEQAGLEYFCPDFQALSVDGGRGYATLLMD